MRKKKYGIFLLSIIIEILTGSSIPKRYWSDLKRKLTKEGSQLYEKIVQLKLQAGDGKNILLIALIHQIYCV
jgi:hypothetical protein